MNFIGAVNLLFLLISLSLLQNANCLHRTETYPPRQLVKLVQPTHDKCVKITGTNEEAIKRFSESPLSELPEPDLHLKCYMHCFYRTLIEHEWSHEVIDPDDLDVDHWFTQEEIDALTKMDDQCEEISVEETANDCEHAYTVVRCLKAANEEFFFLM